MWRSFFEGIEDLFVNVLFAPYDFFRFMESWWASNIVNWIFVHYWIRRLYLLDVAIKGL